MSQKTLLFVDIDGVLSRTLEPLLRFINMSSENGVQMTPRLIDEYNMCACIARVQPRFVQPVDELLHQPFLYSVLEPYTETVSALARHDGPIVFITARKSHLAQVTASWLLRTLRDRIDFYNCDLGVLDDCCGNDVPPHTRSWSCIHAENKAAFIRHVVDSNTNNKRVYQNYVVIEDSIRHLAEIHAAFRGSADPRHLDDLEELGHDVGVSSMIKLWLVAQPYNKLQGKDMRATVADQVGPHWSRFAERSVRRMTHAQLYQNILLSDFSR